VRPNTPLWGGSSGQKLPIPYSIARKVMEVNPQVFLVGEGAERFAAAVGFEKCSLKTEISEKNYTDIITQGQLVLADSDSKVVRNPKKLYNTWLKPFIEEKNLREWHRKLLARSHGNVNVIA